MRAVGSRKRPEGPGRLHCVEGLQRLRVWKARKVCAAWKACNGGACGTPEVANEAHLMPEGEFRAKSFGTR